MPDRDTLQAQDDPFDIDVGDEEDDEPDEDDEEDEEEEEGGWQVGGSLRRQSVAPALSSHK